MRHSFRYGILALCACTMLSNCAWFIPPEKSTPRYNTVVGDPRRPELNPAPGQMPVPTDPSDQVSASDEHSSLQSSDMPSAASPVEGADSVASAPLPPPAGVTPPTGEIARHVPIDNMPPSSGVQMAGNYPSLSSVPPSPAQTEQDDAARLARVRAQLEADRREAEAERARLAGSVAAEPSLANPSPTTSAAPAPIAPLPEPVRVAPMQPPVVAAPAPVVRPMPTPTVTVPSPAPMPTGAPPILNPVPAPVIQQPRFTPPAPLMAPPPAPVLVPQQSSAQPVPTVTVPVAPAPAIASPAEVASAPETPVSIQSYVPPVPSEPPAVAQEPIVLRPPASMVAATAAPSTYNNSGADSASAQPLPSASAGGFNPMADSQQLAGGYRGTYLPPSRYLQQRGYN